MNDRWGHRVGDAILGAVVTRARAYLRTTDTIARVGGDEFILLFPGTDHAAAQGIIPGIHGALVEEMQRNQWPVTFSIGTSSTLGSVTRTAWTWKPSGKVQPVSSYGCFCGSCGLQYW